MKGMQYTGTVKFFSEEKGYGFIIPDSGDDDIFVHANTLKASGVKRLSADDKVAYEHYYKKEGERPAATNIVLL